MKPQNRLAGWDIGKSNGKASLLMKWDGAFFPVIRGEA